ncbi:hypothetical protein TPHA_0I02500 [Tetrapisispora phaffii CBS 4417]|uniref:TrmE-type G domain-containing protein n=1 Tax=Tetrapisispora phaffii (strain ATCC 24235 / CBS 4417 / NBRC 1672 / NRRL Y-8282 / UCD 70-5) TaxID=1071381 RepID=G8BXX5_TETPH|nr:hypothetical protein TPHA_0I02500 [Tetrapisispora phaffii CBS 4417]CCE64753.1 hypothetical protein TPHA_0I02500 [Tetrapisispora phaffii CBS 4417]
MTFSNTKLTNLFSLKIVDFYATQAVLLLYNVKSCPMMNTNGLGYIRTNSVALRCQLSLLPCIRYYSNKLTTNTSYLPTVYALSTSPNTKSAIAVIRITGNHCKHIYHKLTLRNDMIKPREALLRNLYKSNPHKNSRTLLDSSLILFFQSPRSFTGEDLLELHVHGGKVVIQEILKTIQSMHDKSKGIEIRSALAGEFSQRAFQNGKYDLTKIEGIRDIIDAETETQRKGALVGFTGENKILFMNWRSVVLDNIAQLSAIIDFGDDIELDNLNLITSKIQSNIKLLKAEINKFIQKVEKSSILQDGIKVSLLGSTNTGKSSLLNKIAYDDISIVSNIAGTTRDVVTTPVNINGYKIIISDTAGIRNRSQTSDQIERLGMQKAISKVENGDICLIMIDPTNKPLLSPDLLEIIKSPKLENRIVRIIINKSDLIESDECLNCIKSQLRDEYNLAYPLNVISCLTDNGMKSLVNDLTKDFLHLSSVSEDENSIIVSQRVKDILQNDIIFGIENFENSSDDIVLMSENLRDTVEGIGKLTGENIGVEEVLGKIFSSFCIGK